MNSRVGAMQLNLPHSWDACDNADKEFKNPYGSKLSNILYRVGGTCWG
jgi:hypothetical protein